MHKKQLEQIHIVGIRYLNARLVEAETSPLEAYSASDIYQAARVPFCYLEPELRPEHFTLDEVENIGRLGGEIAEAVANGCEKGRGVLVTGGNCSHMTGVLGGLQQAYGAQARIGLVWFDAHGDFNTPRTTISGMLGGMPVAVAAGLAYPNWRERSGMLAPLATDRILMVDVRNLDPAEAQLMRATEVVTAAAAPGFPGVDLQQAVTELAARVDFIYLHIDADILDERYVPNHPTREPNGPDMAQVQAA
ncbi:MAG: arginase family protein, partial [Anaerolineales bacterium]|nr:arginase family protein [Anaerolineales bacterium]